MEDEGNWVTLEEKNIARIAQAALHKLPGKSSLNVTNDYPISSQEVLFSLCF